MFVIPKSVREEYKQDLNLAIKFFVFGIIAGAIFGFTYFTPDKFLNLVNSLFSDITKEISSSNQPFLTTFQALLKRNLTATSIMILLGLLHRSLPLAVVFFNGGIIGVIVWAMLSFGNILYLLMLIPHGIFELPALFLAAAYGVSLTSRDQKGVKARFKTLVNQRRLLLYVIGLLILAGLIEAASITFFG